MRGWQQTLFLRCPTIIIVATQPIRKKPTKQYLDSYIIYDSSTLLSFDVKISFTVCLTFVLFLFFVDCVFIHLRLFGTFWNCFRPALDAYEIFYIKWCFFCSPWIWLIYECLFVGLIVCFYNAHHIDIRPKL